MTATRRTLFGMLAGVLASLGIGKAQTPGANALAGLDAGTQTAGHGVARLRLELEEIRQCDARNWKEFLAGDLTPQAYGGKMKALELRIVVLEEACRA